MAALRGCEPLQAPAGSFQGPLHGEQFRCCLIVVLRRRLVGDDHQPVGEFIEGGGDGGELGERDGHTPMMSD